MRISILGFIFCCFASGASVWIVTGAPGLSSPLDPATQYYRAIEAAETHQRKVEERRRNSNAGRQPGLASAHKLPGLSSAAKTVTARKQGLIEADRSLAEVEISTESRTLSEALSSLDGLHARLEDLLKERGYFQAQSTLSDISSRERTVKGVVSHLAKGKIIIRFGAPVDPVDFLSAIEVPEIKRIAKVAYWVEDVEKQTEHLRIEVDKTLKRQIDFAYQGLNVSVHGKQYSNNLNRRRTNMFKDPWIEVIQEVSARLRVESKR